MSERILKMPRLGETMEEGKIVGFLVKPGDSFKRGDSIIEIETDKTVAEFPALGDGSIVEWIGAIGDHVVVGAPLARILIGAGPDWTADGDDKTSATDSAAAPAAASPSSALVVEELAMPRLGETMDEGRIVRWLKHAGENFARGEAILEIETDKTVAEFPALFDGKLLEIIGQEGEMVTVGAAIARIELAAGDAQTPKAVAAVSTEAAQADATPAQARPARPVIAGQPVRATPVARRLARQNGVDIRALAGSGRRGRVEKQDVLAASGNAAVSSDVSFMQLAGGRIAYLDIGPKNARTFVLLHGFSGDRTTWSGIVAGLQRANCRVIVPDLPAHGLTTLEAATADQLSVFLAEFLDRLSVGTIDLVGHSLGCVAATAFASANPSRLSSLALIAPAGLGLEVDEGFILGMANASSAGEVSHLLRRIAARPPELSPQLAAQFAATMAAGRLKALAGAIVGPSGQRSDIVPALTQLARAKSIRVLVGLQDRIIPWQQVTNLPAQVAVHLLAQSGHMPQWDQTKDVLDILIQAGAAKHD